MDLIGCSVRAQFGGSFFPSVSPGLRSATTYRTWDRIAVGGGVASIQFRYSNAHAGISDLTGDGSTGEVAGAHPLFVTASLEIHADPALAAWGPDDRRAIIVPIAFGGRDDIVLAPGASVWTDEIFVSLAGGQAYYVNSFVSEPIAGLWPIRSQGARGLALGSREGSNMGYHSAAITGDGEAIRFACAIPARNLPILPGSVRVAGPGISGEDDRAGSLSGRGIVSGAVDYRSGDVVLTLAGPPAAGATVYVNIVGGPAPADETKTRTKSRYYATGSGSYGNFAPDAARGRPSRQGGDRLRTIAVVGDSLLVGIGSTSSDVSWVDHCAAEAGLAVMKLAVAGEKASSFAHPAGRHMRIGAIAGACDRIIGNYSTNDIGFGGSLADLQRDLVALWKGLAALCANGAADIWWCTMTPRTSRPDNLPARPAGSLYTGAQAFGPGTVASGEPSVRNAFNAWLYRQVGIEIGGVVDLAAALELNPDSRAGAGCGRWADLMRDAVDGTHPSQFAHETVIPARIGVNGTEPSGVWTFA